MVRLAELLHRETGIVIGETQWPALAAAVGRVTPGLDAKGFLAQMERELGPGPALTRLIEEMTVKETYFMREPRELCELDWSALLARARGRGSDVVRVWVSACATGEEAYTFAMLASEALGSRPPVSILATDISTAALERARAARYSGRSLRNVPAELSGRYFIGDGPVATVKESLREIVRFRTHNIVRDPAPPAGEVPFDVVACRNVLIYFDGPTIERVIASLESALHPDGCLILGVADRVSSTAARAAGVAAAGPPVDRRARRRTLRRPLGREPAGDGVAQPRAPTPRRRTEDRIEDALTAANRGELEAALATIGQLLVRDPLNSDAYLVRGLAELGLGEPRAAMSSLRRALYLDPSFGVAAFQLGRAHELLGDLEAARLAYRRALRTLNPYEDRHDILLEQVDIVDIAAAARERLTALERENRPTHPAPS